MSASACTQLASAWFGGLSPHVDVCDAQCINQGWTPWGCFLADTFFSPCVPVPHMLGMGTMGLQQFISALHRLINQGLVDYADWDDGEYIFWGITTNTAEISKSRTLAEEVLRGWENN